MTRARAGGMWGDRYGPWAVVTDASDGIGRAFALGIADRKVNVALAARRSDRLEEVARTIHDRGDVETRIIPVDLAAPDGVAVLQGIVLSMGPVPGLYPRSLRVATALGSGAWETRFRGGMGGTAFLAALENPHNLELFVPLGGVRASAIDLQLEESHPRDPWSVADIVVHAEP